LPAVPAAKPTIAINNIKFTQSVSLLNMLPAVQQNSTPLTFEALKQDYGYVLYRTKIAGGKSGSLKLKELRDYAVVMVNGKITGTLDRRLKQDSMQVSLPKGEVTLDILVENMGRINFGKYLLQNKKGITEKVTFGGSEIKDWQMFSLPFNDTKTVKFKADVKSVAANPILRKGAFTLNRTGDTYLDMMAWGKGIVWVNGHNLGKYWSIGPQQTLYLPAEWLKKGSNEIVVLELLKPEQKQLTGLQKPVLSMLQR
jgi:beta-galactosidase